jgi:hypothetical protein
MAVYDFRKKRVNEATLKKMRNDVPGRVIMTTTDYLEMLQEILRLQMEARQRDQNYNNIVDILSSVTGVNKNMPPQQGDKPSKKVGFDTTAVKK